jgi:alkanesulfonate monooxygenase SsuD/methylene tetrahydromethanopterin reductase-like flavin-dependent oxidoreductase (luciferase family)
MKITNALLTLNEYAHGRAMVVIGSGGEWPEVMGSAVFKSNYLSRQEHVREAIEISKRAIAETELSYEGAVYSALRFSTAWHKEKPPLIYHGACGPKMLCVGAAAADGVMMSDVMPAMFPARLPVLKRELVFRQDAGSFRISNFVAWHVREDLKRSLAEARRELIIRGWLDRDWLQPFLSEADTRFVLDNRWPFLKAWLERTGNIEGVPARITDTLVRELSLAGDYGSLEAQTERLNTFGDAGFTEIALRLHEEPADSIHLIGRKVLPGLH